MAYDTELADRIRFLIGTGPGVTEKKMFGGLAFLVGGNMAISASGRGGALVRVDPAEASSLVATANATLAVMGGRTMPGWLRVSSEDLEADDQLTEWVNRSVRYARSLPRRGASAGAGNPLRRAGRCADGSRRTGSRAAEPALEVADLRPPGRTGTTGN